MSWEKISKRVDSEIKAGTKIPKTDGNARKITRIVHERIYMRTGVKTKAEKYTTKNMIKFAYEAISAGGIFTSYDVRDNFPREYSQGSCVFSMTGGILEFLDEARCIKKGNRYEYVSL